VREREREREGEEEEGGNSSSSRSNPRLTTGSSAGIDASPQSRSRGSCPFLFPVINKIKNPLRPIYLFLLNFDLFIFLPKLFLREEEKG